MKGSSYWYTSLSVFGFVNVLDFGHSSSCAVVSHCCYNLQFFNDKWYGTTFHMLSCLQYSFFWCDFKSDIWSIVNNSLFAYLLLNFKHSFYGMNNSPLSGMSFATIFSLSVAYLFIRFTVSLAKQKFFYIFIAVLSIISFMGCVLVFYLKSHHLHKVM